MVWKALKACISAVIAIARGLLVTAFGAITLNTKVRHGRSDVNHLELHLGASKLHSLGHLLGGSITLPWLLGVDGEQDHLRLELLQSLRVQLKRLHTLVPGH